MEIILELNKNPIITSYWYYADLVSVAAIADTKNFFVANNYNDIFCDETSDNVFLFFTDILSNSTINTMNMYFECPYLDFQKINKNYFFNINKVSLIDFIKSTINSGYYILLMIDRLYIKEYGFNYSSNHEIMIYGYDDKENKIFFCDNTKTGAYRNDLSCSYSSFTDAFNKAVFKLNYTGDIHPFTDHMYLIKPRKNAVYDLDVKEITQSFKQYLHLEPFLGLNTKRVMKIVSGIQVYDSFINYFKYVSSFEGNNFAKDIRSFCVLWDHKKSILATLNVLYDNNYLDERWIAAYKEIEKKVLVVRNKTQKLYIDNKKNKIESIINMLNEIREEEFSILNCVLGSVK